MNTSMTKTVFFRCTPEMWRKLEIIAEKSIAKNVSDHIRHALERYIEENQPESSNQPLKKPISTS